MAVRDTVMKSLKAISADKESAFYTKLFQEQEPERFALLVIDPRCLEKPLLEALISDLKILSNLNLIPLLLVGALDERRTSVQSQVYRLCQALDNVGIANNKLNCETYEFGKAVRKIVHGGRMPVLEMTQSVNIQGSINLQTITNKLKPFKVIFLQPSGGFRVGGKRLAMVNIDQMELCLDYSKLSAGQGRFVDIVKQLADTANYHCTYVIASPLNLLTELFTVKGAGTMLRRGAKIVCSEDYQGLDESKIRISIETAFGQNLTKNYFARPVSKVLVTEKYRGGAIVTELAGLPYLSKFWVQQEAQGEGIASDLWQVLVQHTPAFFWRSRNSNPFNHWYMKMCEGMQISGDWRVFWIGLKAPEIPAAILAASNALIDFE